MRLLSGIAVSLAVVAVIMTAAGAWIYFWIWLGETTGIAWLTLAGLLGPIIVSIIILGGATFAGRP